MATWHVEVRHEGLSKFRVVRGKNNYEVEQKARAQALSWDAQYSGKLLVEAEQAVRAQERVSKEDKKQEAEIRTAEARAAITGALSILKHTLHVNDRTAWDSLKSTMTFPEVPPQLPIEPEIPARTLLDFIIPSRWKQKLDELEATRREEANLYEERISQWRMKKAEYEERQKSDNATIDALKKKYHLGDPEAVIEYCGLVLSKSEYPAYIKQDFQVEYDAEHRTVVIDFLLPNPDDTPRIREVRYVSSRGEIEERLLKAKEIAELYDSILYQTSIRTCHELIEADAVQAVSAVVFNGFVNYVDKANGHQVRACIMSLHVERERFAGINLDAVDPKQCFRSLKGIAAPQLATLAPVAPIMQLRREDPRFIPGEDVGGLIHGEVNLAAIGWEEFEQLIRQPFEREFAAHGGEVKVTRASRDAGVDAVIFDPDPVRGGKIVVQAKRYTNTVDVSSVRDLYGTILNEGANKGILVTTSGFGPDAYSFAKDKPISLLDGANLLFLLAKHGTKARLDLQEAKSLGLSLQRRSFDSN